MDKTIKISLKRPKYIRQTSYVDDKGIWQPYEEFVPEGYSSDYRLVMSKETFIEAYNRWIKGNKDLLEE